MGIASRLGQPRVLAVIFGSYLSLVAVLAWLFAEHLARPWYDADISRWLYTIYLVASAAFLAGLGVLAFHIQRSFEGRIRRVNRGLGGLLLDDGTGMTIEEVLAMPSEDDPVPADGQLDLGVLLETLGEIQNANLLMVPPKVAAPAVLAAHRLQLALLDKREELQRHERLLTRYVPGPLAVAAVIFSISGTMLPAADGLLQTSFQMNAAVILGIAYAWAGLAGYFAVSILGVVYALRNPKTLPGKPSSHRKASAVLAEEEA